MYTLIKLDNNNCLECWYNKEDKPRSLFNRDGDDSPELDLSYLLDYEKRLKEWNFNTKPIPFAKNDYNDKIFKELIDFYREDFLKNTGIEVECVDVKMVPVDGGALNCVSTKFFAFFIENKTEQDIIKNDSFDDIKTRYKSNPDNPWSDQVSVFLSFLEENYNLPTIKNK